MKKVLVSDFSRVLLFPKDTSYAGGLNRLYDQILANKEDFNDYFKLNDILLKDIEELDIEKYIFTTGKVQNAEFIKHKLDMVFKDIFNVPMIGFKKTDKNAYLKLCEELDLKPSQVMFIDDTEENINAAKEAGLHAVVYHDNNQILNSISEWLT
jgi:HAD superfamily hydrolase (TIGR01509 family)